MGAETTHRGVDWRRDDDGSLHFYDSDRGRWVTWAPGVDAPPVPPEWAPKRARRPGWKTKWRWIPIGIVVVAGRYLLYPFLALLAIDMPAR